MCASACASVARGLRGARGKHDDGQAAQGGFAADAGNELKAVEVRHFERGQNIPTCIGAAATSCDGHRICTCERASTISYRSGRCRSTQDIRSRSR